MVLFTVDFVKVLQKSINYLGVYTKKDIRLQYKTQQLNMNATFCKYSLAL